MPLSMALNTNGITRTKDQSFGVAHYCRRSTHRSLVLGLRTWVNDVLKLMFFKGASVSLFVRFGNVQPRKQDNGYKDEKMCSADNRQAQY